jgi:hypothetical protein
MSLPSCATVVHVTEACNVTVVARITALVFTIDVCNGFSHAWKRILAEFEFFTIDEETYRKAE